MLTRNRASLLLSVLACGWTLSGQRPDPPRRAWIPLIGDYAGGGRQAMVLERGGRLYLREGEKETLPRHQSGSRFRTDPAGFIELTPAELVLGEVRLSRQSPPAVRIKPNRPVEELRRAALAARPPPEEGRFERSDLVELTALDPSVKLDIRYAGPNNFLGTALYTHAQAFLQRPAAEALVRAHRALARRGYGLLVFDGYRPWYVTRVFWDATPEAQRAFVADPAKGSRHNRGCAVDLTLYHRKGGAMVEMTGAYDEMSARSYPDYPGGTSLQRWHRDLLRKSMEEQGFSVYPAEWWHYDYKDWQRYPIQNLPFDRLRP